MTVEKVAFEIVDVKSHWILPVICLIDCHSFLSFELIFSIFITSKLFSTEIWIKKLNQTNNTFEWMNEKNEKMTNKTDSKNISTEFLCV